ncbi:MAG TPA: response regulator transcription factor [Vicinamibacterales bacterium]|nr:response regulator transcription factor [Vicinamibacterales bacterium]
MIPGGGTAEPRTVTALVIDDEPLARRKVRELLNEVAWIECVGEVGDGRSAVRAIDEQQPDLVFLDIRMPGYSGLEILRRVTHVPAVIFTTAYDRYAVTAFELAAVDYLLKPFSRDRFLRALARARPALESRAGTTSAERAQEALGTAPASRLFVREHGRVVPLRASLVERLEACDDFAYAHVQGRRYRINATLNDLEQRLDPAVFIRIHRSHIVNLDHVSAWTPYDGSRFEVRLRDGTVLMASRQRSRALRRLSR